MSDLVRFNENEGFLKRAVEYRARLLNLLREFFGTKGFLEVETPIVCSSPGVETHLAALQTSVGSRTMYLTTSPEFHMKRMLAAGFESVFQVTRSFRDGEKGDLHNPEFTIVEWYRTGVDYRAIMKDCEELLSHLARGLNGSACSPSVPGKRCTQVLDPPFHRITFEEAFRAAGAGDPLSFVTDKRDQVFVERVEPLLGRDAPVFLTDYPADQASLARLRPGEPGVAERFEMYAGGLELANGFTEITDRDEYLARCESDLASRKRLGLPGYPVDERYVSMLGEGLPESAGVALGLDRVVMLLIGASSIRDVMAFPVDVC